MVKPVLQFAGRSAMLATGLTLLVGSVLGCSSRPSAVATPRYDPAAFAESLLKRFDANGDGALSKEEGEQSPGLIAAWSRYDANNDGSIARDELVARAQKWIERGDGVVSISCIVRLGGKQLADVHVKLIPDESLVGVIKPAEALTVANRASSLSIPPDLKPEAHRNLAGMQYGLYRVEVSHPQLQIVPTRKSSGRDVGAPDQSSPIVIEVQRQ